MALPLGLAITGVVAGRKSRIPRQASPSLIQVLEDRKLLSTAENLKLLSAAEKAGLTVSAVEQSGFLKIAEDGQLLTKAEGILTSPSSPTFFLGCAILLAGLTFLDVSGLLASSLTGLPVDGELGFTEQVLGVLFGVPALALGVAGFVIGSLFGGVTRSKELKRVDKVEFDNTTGQFKPSSQKWTLLDTLQEKKLLSFAQQAGLLSTLGKFIDKPLTFAEENRLLSLAESLGLLSLLESQSIKGFQGFAFLGIVLLFVAAAGVAFLADPNLKLLAGLSGVAGAVLTVAGTALTVLLSPARN